MLIIGLSGLLLTSASGANIQFTPSARASLRSGGAFQPAAIPHRGPAAKAMLYGHCVALFTRMDAPRSKSAPISSGILDIS